MSINLHGISQTYVHLIFFGKSPLVVVNISPPPQLELKQVKSIIVASLTLATSRRKTFRGEETSTIHNFTDG